MEAKGGIWDGKAVAGKEGGFPLSAGDYPSVTEIPPPGG
jgi:hypothetical protein